jgi:hypothetical protein
MTNMEIVENSTKRDVMEMDNLLDMLQKARVERGFVVITQKTKEEQSMILRIFMQKFDAKEDAQTVIDSKWGIDGEGKGMDPDEQVNLLECRKLIT